MTIALIGWGDMIWNPDILQLGGGWRPGGPDLPIEFCRIGGGFRVTLAFLESDEKKATYWAPTAVTDLVVAAKNLRQRLKSMPDVMHFVTKSGDSDKNADAESVELVAEWLEGHPSLEAAVWCGLRSNWETKRQKAFSVEDVVDYLRELELSGRVDPARQYFVRAPLLNRTPLWDRVMSSLSWEPEESEI